MEEEIIGDFEDKTYRGVDFKPSNLKDTACDHCAFELGKCKGAIWVLGQCYVVENGKTLKNIYYEQINKELIFLGHALLYYTYNMHCVKTNKIRCLYITYYTYNTHMVTQNYNFVLEGFFLHESL